MITLSTKTLLFAITTLASQQIQAASGLIPVGSSGGMNHFIDSATVRQDGNLVRYQLSGTGVRGTEGKYTAEVGADCVGRTRIEYQNTRVRADGKITTSSAPSPKMYEVFKGTSQEQELGVACQLAGQTSDLSVQLAAIPASLPAAAAVTTASGSGSDVAVACPAQPSPGYPSEALQSRSEGVVKAQFVIRDGAVKSVRILSGPAIFHESVRNALLQYKCTGGTDRDVVVTQAFNFKHPNAENVSNVEGAGFQSTTAAQSASLPLGKRVALVIGNAAYKVHPLRNPRNDADDVSRSLKVSGFEVIDLRDASLTQMRSGIRQFGDKLLASDAGLVYYSGHGIEIRGRNYFIPVNADIQREDEVSDQSLDVALILEKMSTAQKAVNILIVDACRDDPFGRSFRSSSKGLASMEAPRGTIVAYATSPGKVAADGDGRNSPYTKHLVRAMQAPNKPIELVFKEVRRAVQDETKNLQTPWENTSLSGDFYFRVQK